MSKLMSEEQIREAFEQWLGIKPERVNHMHHDIYRNDIIHWEWAAFKAAFTLLMPIIERQETALMEINDLLLDGKSMYVADRVTIAHKALKETKQMLEKQLEEVSDHKER